jgi:hypothetical protein
MNRKNMTAAVLAGLAGIAGIAGTAQAVNLNPDGLGQVLIYPYYTSNGGNQTLLSVVNTTDSSKAVKVRFLEGFNSREVLDFNLYLSPWDVWGAAIYDDSGVPTLGIIDDSCTVPYLFGDFGGKQAFLDLAYNDNALFSNDGGPTGIARAAEGHFEMIEMGTVIDDSVSDMSIRHVTHEVLDDDDEVIDTFWAPGDCDELVEAWTRNADYSDKGRWTVDATEDMTRNSGGMFGGGSIVNANNGTMYSYDAIAIQGYDKTDGQRHEEPGTIHPSLNEGSENYATVFFGVPTNQAVTTHYPRPVGAISSLFMHEHIMNEYTINEILGASTEWVITFPTKNFYVDFDLVSDLTAAWVPDGLNTGDDPECNSWIPGEPFPHANTQNPDAVTGEPQPNPITAVGWEGCTYIPIIWQIGSAIEPFTDLFDGKACETAGLTTWDRDERSFNEERGGERPPVVSPSIPQPCDPELQFCEETEFQLCYEVNVMRFGDGVIFDTPVVEGSSLLLSVTPASGPDAEPFTDGWGRINFGTDIHHQDYNGLVGLPVTGFAAYEFENNFVDGAGIKAFYGGLFGHKANVRRKTQHDHPEES